MNAAKAKKNPAKVKGAVLIMILAVMTVLIILLAGSIAVVYSAHNRAFVKYTESQGYYTARSILDNFYAELNNDDSFQDSAGTNIGTYYKLDKTHTVMSSEDLGIARALELDTYKAKVEVKDASGAYLEWFMEYCDKNANTLGAIVNGFEGSSTVYSPNAQGHYTSLYPLVEKYLVNLDKNLLGDYSTYNNYYDQYLPVTSVAAGMKGNTIVYELSSLDGFGSGTIDTDGDGNPDTSINIGNMADSGVEKAWVTVEVQERILAMGDGSSYEDRFRAAGNHQKDHFKAKVTAHVIYNGEEMTTSLIWQNTSPPVIDTTSGLPTVGPIDTTTSLTVIGNAASLDPAMHELTNNSTYSGNIFLEGSFNTGTSTPTVMMNEENAFFVRDTLKIYTNPPQGEQMVDGAVFYTGRTQLWSSGASFGTPFNQSSDGNDHRINLITKNFESHSDTKEFYGRIFADKFDVTTPGSEMTQSYVKGAVPTNGYTFPNSTKRIHADVYCNFLGVPADRVYVELNDATGVAVFHINWDPVAKVALGPTDPKRIENMVSGGNTINVFQGISVINSVVKETKPTNTGGTTDILVNGHEKYWYTYNGILTEFDYFRDAGTAGASAPGANFKALDTDCTIQMNHMPVTGTDYQVQIDWTNVDPSIVKTYSSLNLDMMDYIDYDADKADGVWTLDDSYHKKFTLPSVNGTQLKLIGTNKSTYKLPTHRSIYGNYFYGSISSGTSASAFPKSFDADTAAFSMKPNDTSYPFTFDTFIKEHSIEAEAIIAGIGTEGPVDILSVPDFTIMTNAVSAVPGGGDTVNGVAMPSWQRVISESGYIPANGGDGNTYYIDARSNDINIQLGDGSSYQTFTGTYVVYGDKHVTVTVPGCTSAPAGQTVNLGTSGCPFTFMTEPIYSGIFKDVLVLGDPVSNKPDAAHSGEITPPPNIDWYFSSKKLSTAHLETGGGGMTAMCGYIVAPTVFFDLISNINGLHRETWFYGEKVPSGNDQYTFFGSVFCYRYKGGQHAGVCYIPRKIVQEDNGNKRAFSPQPQYSAAR